VTLYTARIPRLVDAAPADVDMGDTPGSARAITLTNRFVERDVRDHPDERDERDAHAGEAQRPGPKPLVVGVLGPRTDVGEALEHLRRARRGGHARAR